MTIEEELVYWREEKIVLREQLVRRDERIQQQEVLAERSRLGRRPEGDPLEIEKPMLSHLALSSALPNPEPQ